MKTVGAYDIRLTKELRLLEDYKGTSALKFFQALRAGDIINLEIHIAPFYTGSVPHVYIHNTRNGTVKGLGYNEFLNRFKTMSFEEL